MNNLMYQCQVCRYLTPRLPHSPHQICPHCQMDFKAELDAETTRYGELVACLIIGAMIGVIVAKSFL